ncbi:MAG: beta-ketoacyl-ACP synthase [Treponema sp.]|jgi:3-oxoacyl-[acyl-carrier-protein] synthase II|nr:beta-ketoacyl-ACP synthase [Treponema sp.]
MSANNERKRVVITGGAVASALGVDWPAILARLKTGKNCVRVMNEWNVYEKMNTRLAAPVDCVFPEYPRKKIRGMGRVALFALYASDMAMQMSGLSGSGGTDCSPEVTLGRCGVAYGSSMGSVDPLVEFFTLLVDHDLKHMSATTYIKSMPQTCAANLEVFYGLTGRLITVNTACTSGSMAIGSAYEVIQRGVQDIMIAGGADELSPADAAVFDTLFATSTQNEHPELTPAAYDKNRDGLVIGEGAGTLILEEYEHARSRGAVIYAEVAGFGTNTDGTHITQPNRETMAKAMKLALDDAGIAPDAVGYVNTHGTATGLGDIAESAATEEVFGRSVPASTLKNYIGHTLGACGAIEAWISVNMMREGWYAPNINLRELDGRCGKLDYITGEGRALETEYVMSNNFAFGGINTSLIFKRI